MKYLLSFPGVGGYYGATIGAAKDIIDRIYKNNPNAIIEYSGVSSGAFCALMMLISLMDMECGCDKKKHSHTKYISHMHKEFVKCINDSGKWSDSIFDYYHNNNIYFVGVEKFIRTYVKDIKTINNKLHIGYCRILDTNELEFNVVSNFMNVDDLVNALMASSHYALFLKNQKYFEFREQKCVDGVFINQNVHLPDYINVKINNQLLDDICIFDKLLVPCHKKFKRLYKHGKKIQKTQKLNTFNITEDEVFKQTQFKNTFKLWDIISLLL